MLERPILIYSDPHYHDFAQFAVTDRDGLNSRLAATMRATDQAVTVAKSAGANMGICCGDIFHVRGKVKPSVLNPVTEMFEDIRDRDFKIHAISGNHDLETERSSTLNSAITSLNASGVAVYSDEPVTKQYAYNAGSVSITFVPWEPDLKKLRALIKAGPKLSSGVLRYALVIHAPMNGVVTGLPDHGLTVNDFKDTEWDKVFIGHYHNHKSFTTGKTEVISVGALTHQNWGDTDSKAGFLLWHPLQNTIEHYETNAPKFLKVHIDDLDDTNVVDHFVKVVGGSFDDAADIQDLRNELILRGAKAVVVEGTAKRPAVTRSGATTRTEAPTIHSILGEYVERTYPGEPQVMATSLDILKEVYYD